MTGLDASIAAPRTAAGSVRTLVGDALAVFVLAGRVLRQHWPVLLAIALCAEILRGGALRLAAWVWYEHGAWYWLVFAVAPAVVSLAFVLMLLRVRSSLPGLPAQSGSPWTRAGTLALAFLVFYQQAGYLAADADQLWTDYTDTSFDAENILRTGYHEHFGNIGAIALPVLVGVGVGIVVLRWLVGRLPVVKRHPALNLPTVYLEVLFVLVGIVATAQFLDRLRSWAQQRRAWVGVVDWLHSDFGWAGPGGGTLRAVSGWWTSVWSTVHSGLLIPILAITTGAIVYGVKIERESRPLRPRAVGTFAVAARTLASLAWRPVDSRVRPVLQGLRVMLSVGVVATLAFGLAYVALGAVGTWDLMWERALIGPQDDYLFWWPVGRMLIRFNSAVLEVLAVSLIAGAVGRVSQRLTQSRDVQAQEPRLERL